MATATHPMFAVHYNLVSKCKICGAAITWQRSRWGKMYPTNVHQQHGILETSRVDFHHCDPAVKAAYQKSQLEAAGQQSMLVLDLSGINKLFETATQNKLKWPKIHLNTLQGNPVMLYRAGARSKYNGQLMVTDGQRFGSNIYYGRIEENGTWHPAHASTKEVEQLLEQLAADPTATAAKYGKLTGNCCFCHKKLEDQRSTDVGYGPVCAKKFGLAWG